MKTRINFPRPTREVEHFWITLTDGSRLAGRMWLPVDAEERPVPAILLYSPYRKSDACLPGLSETHPYLAGHGYAAVWVDIRGSGESDGILTDEYSAEEQADGVEVIGWLAAQPWCSGGVGMWGHSWPGCNALQVAALRPPALAAVISIGSMVDGYDEDLYYWGGCLLGSHLDWAMVLHCLMAQPPRPSLVGERWRTMWTERLEQMASFVEIKLSHQRRDPYWRRASIAKDYGAITCPVYMVGGWADGYVSAILRFLAAYPGPRKGLIGPWWHGLPFEGGPGPAIGFLQECLRWWDHWLKGIETSIMEEPMLRTWLQESVPPRVQYDERPGRWVAEPAWPAPAIEARSYALNPDVLAADPLPETPLIHRSPQHLGAQAGRWMIYLGSGFPLDQHEDDALALTFTSPPLEQRLEILGFPEVVLELAADKPAALIAVRLCDVAPDGASSLITRGLLNLTHRESHAHPTPLEPGRRYRVRVEMCAVGYSVTPGHRLRLSVSSSYWPFVWPSPESTTLTVFAGPASRLVLPIREPRQEDADLAAFEEPETAPPVALTWTRPSSDSWTTTRDLTTGGHETAYRTDGGRWRLEGTPLEYGYTSNLIATITEGEPLSARLRYEGGIELAEDDWQTRVEVTGLTTADRGTFRVTIDLAAYEGDVRTFARIWNLAIRRDLI